MNLNCELVEDKYQYGNDKLIGSVAFPDGLAPTNWVGLEKGFCGFLGIPHFADYYHGPSYKI